MVFSDVVRRNGKIRNGALSEALEAEIRFSMTEETNIDKYVIDCLCS